MKSFCVLLLAASVFVGFGSTVYGTESSSQLQVRGGAVSVFTNDPLSFKSTVNQFVAQKITELMQKTGIWYLQDACSEDEMDDEGKPKGCPEGSNVFVPGKKRPYTVLPENVWMSDFVGKKSLSRLAVGTYNLSFQVSDAIDKRGKWHQVSIYGYVKVVVSESPDNQSGFKVTMEISNIGNANYGVY